MHLEPGSEEAGARQDLALKLMRELQAYEESLPSIQAVRSEHANKDGIAFEVGDLVRHKTYGFRAVVVGWDRYNKEEASGGEGGAHTHRTPHFRVVPDAHDFRKISTHHGESARSKLCYLPQDQIERLDDLNQCRIAMGDDMMQAYFSRFDPAAKRFVPNEELGYIYWVPPSSAAPLDDSCESACLAVRAWSIALATKLFSMTQASSAGQRVSSVAALLRAMSEGRSRPTVDDGYDLMQQWHILIDEVYSSVELRRQGSERLAAGGLKFSVGDTVISRMGSFRGVVLGMNEIFISDPPARYDPYTLCELWINRSDGSAAQVFELPHRLELEGSLRLKEGDRIAPSLPVVGSFLNDLFEAYLPYSNRFIPTERLRFKYPDERYYVPDECPETSGLYQRSVDAARMLKEHDKQHKDTAELLGRLLDSFTSAVQASLPTDAINVLLRKAATMKEAGVALKMLEVKRNSYNHSNPLVEAALRAFQRKHYVESLAYYDRALEIAPGHAETMTQKVLLLLEIRRYHECIKLAQLILEKSPDTVGLQKAKGEAYLKLEMPDEAAQCFERELALNPWDSQASAELYQECRKQLQPRSDCEEEQGRGGATRRKQRRREREA
ncbi:unnamed protein product [Chrysoparadoxa australica]